MTPDPVPRSLVAVDIEGFGRRGDLDHLHLRKALRDVCADAFAQINVHDAQQADRGDALLIVVGPDVPKPRLVNDLVRELDIALRRFNSRLLPRARMRLRVAIHNGEVLFDGNGELGLGGEAVVALMRLIDAKDLKEALVTAPDDLAVIVSDRMHHDAVVQRHRGIDPGEYREVHVALKEFIQPAWIRVPGLPPGGVPPAESSGGGRPTAGAGPSPALPGGVSFTGPTNFHGPTSFGRDAIGGDINVAGRDVNVAGRSINVNRPERDA